MSIYYYAGRPALVVMAGADARNLQDTVDMRWRILVLAAEKAGR